MIKKSTTFLLIFTLTFIALGEFDFRVNQREQRLQYVLDPDTLWRLKPGQVGFEWLANMSLKSPPIRINQSGYRGNEVDFSEPKINILAVGSSSALGAGVYDDETWTSQLQNKLGDDRFRVLNAANPGWGPYQHAAIVKKQINHIEPHLLLIMVASHDLGFLPKNEKEKEAYLKSAERRKMLLSISPFLTFSLRKGEYYYKSFKSSLVPNIYKNKSQFAHVSKQPSKTILMHEQKPYWQEMIALAQEKNIPLIFFVPNLQGDKSNEQLAIYLETLIHGYNNVKVIELESAGEMSKDQYLIPNDGHPNASYHLAMASFLVDHIGERLQGVDSPVTTVGRAGSL